MVKTTTTTTTTTACNCVGPQNNEPLCPCDMRTRGIFKRNDKWIEPASCEKILGDVIPTIDELLKDYQKPRGGLEPIEEKYKCMDPEHEPPGLLHIPYGHQYRHVCPTCGMEQILRSSEARF